MDVGFLPVPGTPAMVTVGILDTTHHISSDNGTLDIKS